MKFILTRPIIHVYASIFVHTELQTHNPSLVYSVHYLALAGFPYIDALLPSTHENFRRAYLDMVYYYFHFLVNSVTARKRKIDSRNKKLDRNEVPAKEKWFRFAI